MEQIKQQWQDEEQILLKHQQLWNKIILKYGNSNYNQRGVQDIICRQKKCVKMISEIDESLAMNTNIIHIVEQGKIYVIGNILRNNKHKFQLSNNQLLLTMNQQKDYEEKIKTINGEELFNYINEMRAFSQKYNKIRNERIEQTKQRLRQQLEEMDD